MAKRKMLADIVTGREAECLYCGEWVREVKDPYSGCLDYEGLTPEGTGNGDFGCGEGPCSNEDGTDGHWPLIKVTDYIRKQETGSAKDAFMDAARAALAKAPKGSVATK